MTLVKIALERSLREIMDPEYVDFQGFPQASDVAIVWGDIIDSYAKSVIPTSLTSQQARAVFISNMSAISPVSQNGMLILIQSLTLYANALAIGMNPSFTGIGPIVPIDLSTLIALGSGGAKGEITSKLLAKLIHIWIKTGLATNNSSGVSIPWN